MKVKKIHFVGIKGVGMTPLAIIAKEAGLVVTGCDVDEVFITDDPLEKAGIRVFRGFDKEHISDSDLVITTGAHGGFDNIEVKFAKEKGIQVITQGEAVGLFMQGEILSRNDLQGISVAGSHGKTTTTAMIATVLNKAGLDPSYVIGTGVVASLGNPGHFGLGRYFVVEADEYATEPTYNPKPKFLWQKPEIAVFTNIELDHPDLYPTEDSVREAFLHFANQTKILVAYGDDMQVQKLLKDYKKKAITYGTSDNNDFVIKKIYIGDENVFFWLEGMGTNLGEFNISVIGEHNAFNASASIIVGLETGLKIEAIKKGLVAYKGSKRRSEYIGQFGENTLVYDDYGHHPTEITKTLLAFKKHFPKHRIICVYQPHSYSRTIKLFEQFVHSFSAADEVIMLDIYPSFRETDSMGVSSRQLVIAMSKIHPRALFLPKRADVVKYIQDKNINKPTLLVTMGAGDVYKIAEELVFE